MHNERKQGKSDTEWAMRICHICGDFRKILICILFSWYFLSPCQEGKLLSLPSPREVSVAEPRAGPTAAFLWRQLSKQLLVLFVCLMLVIRVSMKWYLMVFICISLTTRDGEHHSMCWLATFYLHPPSRWSGSLQLEIDSFALSKWNT